MITRLRSLVDRIRFRDWSTMDDDEVQDALERMSEFMDERDRLMAEGMSEDEATIQLTSPPPWEDDDA